MTEEQLLALPIAIGTTHLCALNIFFLSKMPFSFFIKWKWDSVESFFPLHHLPPKPQQHKEQRESRWRWCHAVLWGAWHDAVDQNEGEVAWRGALDLFWWVGKRENSKNIIVLARGNISSLMSLCVLGFYRDPILCPQNKPTNIHAYFTVSLWRIK